MRLLRRRAVRVLRQPCRMPTSRLASWRSAAWWSRPAGALFVVVGACAGRGLQRDWAWGMSASMSRSLCTNRASTTLRLAGLAGDRAGAGVVLAGLGVGVTSWGVTEFGEHPGAKDRSHAGLGQDDLSVRVPAKMLLHLPLQGRDLFVEGAQYRHDRASGGRVRAGDDRVAAELLAAQRGLDAGGLGVDVAAAGMFERGPDLAAVQLRRRGRVRRLAQQLSASGASRSSKASSAAGKYSRSPCRSRSSWRVRSQISVLCTRATTFTASARGAVGRDRAQLMRVGADHVGQGVRVGGVALGAGHAVAFPVPGRLQRVHRVHRVAGARPAPPPTGRGRSRSRPAPRPRRRPRRAARRSSRAAGRSRPRPPAAAPWPARARLVHQLDIVMILRPIVSHEQQFASPICSVISNCRQRAGELSAT